MDLKKVNNITAVSISELGHENFRKIFEDLIELGVTEVYDENKKLAVLISPARFDEMNEIVENYELLLTALNRMTISSKATNTMDEVMNEFGITLKDLEKIDVDLDL